MSPSTTVRCFDWPVVTADGNSFWLAMGLGAIVGVIFSGWIMSMIQKLMIVLVKTALLGAVVVLGILLWNNSQTNRPEQPQAPPYQSLGGVRAADYQPEGSSSTADDQRRWWEE